MLIIGLGATEALLATLVLACPADPIEDDLLMAQRIAAAVVARRSSRGERP